MDSPSPSPLTLAVGHGRILAEHHSDVFKKYKIISTIGTGSLGHIDKVQLREDQIGGSAFQHKNHGLLGFGLFPRLVKTGELQEEKSQFAFYALKSILLDRISAIYVQELKNEIEILRNMDHPNIVKAYEVYTFKRQIYLLMELCEGGDLYRRAPYSERHAACIVAQLLSAIRYMHDHGVVHRDLKFENVMFASTQPDSEIKVIDFGLSKKFLGAPGIMTERVGTIYTMSPEVIQQSQYSSKADLWSIGAMAYMLLSSTKPFHDKRISKMINFIVHAAYNYSGPTWKTVSDDAKDFVNNLLVIDQDKRYSAEQATKHKWILHRQLLPDEIPSEEVLAKIDHSLLNYRHSSELKKLALAVVAHRSSQQKIIELRKVFDQYDTEHNGVLTFQEFRVALIRMGYPEDVVAEIFSSVDMDKSGEIMWTEFLAATIDAQGHIEEDRVAEAFDRLDCDNSGFISAQNLRNFLGASCSQEQLDAILQKYDGQISYHDFLADFRKQTASVIKSISKIESSAENDESDVLYNELRASF